MNRPLALCTVASLLSACDPALEDEIEAQAPAEAVVGSGWSDKDIGPVGKVGKDTLASGVHTMTASGADIYGATDQFHFVYQLVAGNATVTARAVSLTNTNASAKAVVMIRETLDANSMFVASELTPTGTNKFRQQARTSTGGAATLTKSTADSKLNTYLRVKRSINATTGVSTFTTYYSTDGTTWKQISTASMKMNGAAYVGIGATSHDNTKLTTAKFDKVNFSGTLTACAPNTKRCSGTSAQTCSTDGAWKTTQQCPSQCTSGQCTEICKVDATRCNGDNVEVCKGDSWAPSQTCTQTCISGACTECIPDHFMCKGNILSDYYMCDATGHWTLVEACSAACASAYCGSQCVNHNVPRYCVVDPPNPGGMPTTSDACGLSAMNAFYCAVNLDLPSCDPTKNTYLYEYNQTESSYSLDTTTYWVCDQDGVWMPGS